MKAKTIIAAVFTALCWISLCLDWDPAMYLTGFIALVIVYSDDLKVYYRFAKLTSQRRIRAYRSIRKEVVKA